VSGLKMKYFVLKPAGDGPYAVASRKAMKAYAESIRDVDAELYNDLEQWRITEQGKSNQRSLERKFKS